MLLKKSLMLSFVFLLVIGFVSASTCPSESNFSKQTITCLQSYFYNPEEDDTLLAKLKDLLVFYFSNADVGVVECHVNGTNSGMYVDEILQECSIDKSKDSDEDGMPDDWEDIYKICGLNPNLFDALLDADEDLLENLGEYQNNTNPCELDSDGDGHTDYNEVLAGSDPTNSSDIPDDYDDDGMPDFWENLYGFNFNNASDASQDFDGDGITNLQEYQILTNPKENSSPTDTDKDGIPDAWEILFGFNKNDPSDASMDADGDGYTNLQEYRNGTHPRVSDVPDSAGYKTYTFEIDHDTDLSEASGWNSLTSVNALYIHTNQPDGLQVGGVTTDKVWLYKDSGSSIQVFYEYSNGKTKHALEISSQPTTTLGKIIYGDTNLDISINSALTANPYIFIDYAGTRHITLRLGGITNEIDRLGYTPNLAESEEILYSSTYLGTTNNDYTTFYGIIIRNPMSHGASDKVVLEIPNAQIETKPESCTTQGDEDGNGDCDYDRTTCEHGDIACPVEVTALTVSNTNPSADSNITAECNATLPVNSIEVAVNGVACAWNNWIGNTASFTCNVGSTTGTKQVACVVNTNKSFRKGTSQYVTINVQSAQTCPDKPDLTVTDIEFTPSDPKVGDSVNRVEKFKNLGGVASPIVNFKGYVDDIMIAYGSTGSLQPGATREGGSLWTAIAGTHKFEFVIDADNHAAECNETNNNFIKYITVSGGVCAPEEQLIVDFKSSAGATTTSQYSGLVNVSVVGTGQCSGTAYNDAFYVYTDYNGNPVTPYILNPFMLYINGKNVTDYVSPTPSYNAQHNYNFVFDIGTTSKKLTFRIGDGYTADNSGSFTIGMCTDAIGKCLDGTAYGQCSTTKPKYCDNGNLMNKCSTCGCPTGTTCQADETCESCGVDIPIATGSAMQNIADIYGNKIVWTDDRNGNKDIYMYDLSTGKETQITTNTATQSNPKIYGNQMVWADSRTGKWEIYTHDLSTGEEKQITTANASRMYLPDSFYGDKIVWADDRNGNYDVYMYDLSTGQETRITTNTADQEAPVYYGNIIVWQDSRQSVYNKDIYMYDLSSGKETSITTAPSQQVSPAIYGNKIVWIDNRNGNNDIYMYDLSTGQETQITSQKAARLETDIYGDKIVWQDDRNGNYDVYMYDLSTGQETRITTNTAQQGSPAIYSNNIVWVDARVGNYDIYMTTIC